jgi:hypothetical protein
MAGGEGSGDGMARCSTTACSTMFVGSSSSLFVFSVLFSFVSSILFGVD